MTTTGNLVGRYGDNKTSKQSDSVSNTHVSRIFIPKCLCRVTLAYVGCPAAKFAWYSRALTLAQLRIRTPELEPI